MAMAATIIGVRLEGAGAGGDMTGTMGSAPRVGGTIGIGGGVAGA